jgi:predicted enzyme related to lactoylglutathione lyase
MATFAALGSLSRIIIYAGDAVRCARFFEEHFGLTPVGEFSPEWAELDAGACRLAFHQAYGESGPITSATGSPSNPHKIVFTVPDVAEARQRLVDGGVAMGEIHHFEDQGNLIICQGTDPEGHVFQLCNR